MPDTPKRTLIRNKIAALLATIAAGATYHTNLGQHINVWRPLSVPFEASELPAVNIRDKNDAKVSEQFSGANELWTRQTRYELDIIATSPEEYDKCVADIYTVLTTSFNTDQLGDLALDINCDGEEADVDQEEHRIDKITTTILVLYRTERFIA